MTVTFWVNRNYIANGGHVLFEATPDYRQSTTGFSFQPDDQNCQGMQAALRGNVGYTANCYAQPSSGRWHHFAVIYDKSQTAGDQITLFLDGELQRPTRSLLASTNTNSFGDNPIYLFARGGTTMFESGAVADFQIYDSALTVEQIEQVYRSGALVSLEIRPEKASVAPGMQQQFVAIGTYRDGAIRNLTDSTTWVALPSSIASINGRGLVEGTSPGSASITATSSFARAAATVVVTRPSSDTVAPSSSARPPSTSGWQQGFDFRNTPNYVTDPSTSTYVLATTSYPTTYNGTTYGWANTGLVGALDRSTSVDPRIAGMNFNKFSSPPSFYVDLPAPGTYDIALAIGDANSGQCSAGCRLQLKDGSTVLATITGGRLATGYFYDAIGNAWSASQWPSQNQTRQVTLTGTRLTATVGSTGLSAMSGTTALAYLGLTQVSTTSDFTLAASPTSLSVVRGNQGISTLTTTVTGGFNNAVTLSASGVPSGTSVNFSPNPIAAPGSGSSTMTFTVGSSTATGTYPITVTGTGGGIQHTTTVTLTVTAQPNFTLAASPTSLSVVRGNQGISTLTTTVTGGFNNAVTLSASGVPSGTSVNFSPNPIAAPGSGSSTMTFTVGSSTATGTYPITVTGTGGGIQHTTTVALTVTAQPNFTLAASPTSLSVVRGNQGISTLTTTVTGGFNNAVTLSASGVPSGTSVNFSPNPIAAPGSGSSTMTFTVGSSTATGTYPITVTGTGGGIQHTTTVTLTVTAQPNFTLAASPTSLSVVRGNQGISTLTTTVTGGFNNAVTLSASGVPSGTSVNFSPNPIAAPGSGSSTMTFTVGSSTATGTYPITVTGTGGGIQHTTTVTLTVTAPVLVSIAVTPANPSIAVGQQQQFTSTGTYSDGSHQDLTSAATWTSSATSVATISSSGLATAVTAGSATIKATSGSINGSTILTVTGVVQTSYTIWQPTTTPVVADSGDGSSVELGVKFRVDYAGYITGLRFYKANKNVGTHIGNIWTTSGNLLGTATFTNETASGWQQVWFNNPIPVTANTVYVASYFAPAGHYSDDDGYFASKGVDNPPLHGLANGVSGANGVYVYHSTSAFPTTGYLSTNYWVDVVYTTSSTYSISGTISGAGGAGATVSLTGVQTATTTADGSGNYTFAGLGNGSYTVTPGNSGVTFSPPTRTVTINGASVTGVDFTATLTNSFSISGTISAGGGPGATVNLTGARTAATTADGSGNYSFSGLANGSYTVTPSKSGYSYTPASQAVTVNGVSVTGVNFTSTGQTYGISGTISGSGGPGATVNLTGARTATTTTDGSGNYSFSGLSNGSYTVTPSKSGYSYTPASRAVTVNGTSVGSVNFSSVVQSHWIDLSWTASVSPVIGYNIYRSNTSGGPYAKLNGTVNSSTTYTDTNVLSGYTYYYVTTAVDVQLNESAYSNEAFATIP